MSSGVRSYCESLHPARPARPARPPPAPRPPRPPPQRRAFHREGGGSRQSWEEPGLCGRRDAQRPGTRRTKIFGVNLHVALPPTSSQHSRSRAFTTQCDTGLLSKDSNCMRTTARTRFTDTLHGKAETLLCRRLPFPDLTKALQRNKSVGTACRSRVQGAHRTAHHPV